MTPGESGAEVSESSEQAESAVVARPRSEMTEEDWTDVMESEFVDFVESGIHEDPAFVFEHPEIGYHGFRLRRETGVLEPTGFDKLERDTDE